jgi:hypothetical protein
MESAVLMRLNFRLATATCKKFLYRYVKAAGFTEREAELVHVSGSQRTCSAVILTRCVVKMADAVLGGAHVARV